MKYLVFIIPLFIIISFSSNKHIHARFISRDTVPTGAPQLFGSKLYEFKNYLLVDSMVLMKGGDTLLPYWPALKFKTSDHRFYGYDSTSWKRFLISTDTVNQWINNIRRRSGNDSIEVFKNGVWSFVYKDSFPVIIVNNGVSKNNDTIQFGQTVSAVGNPAALTHNTEVPHNGFNIVFTGTGGISVGSNTLSNTKLNVVATSSLKGMNATSVDGTTIQAISSGAGTAIFGQTQGTGQAAISGSNAGASGYGVLATSSNNNATPLRARAFNTNNNLASPVIAEFVRDANSGVASDGIGGTLMFKAQTTVSADQEAGQFRFGFSTALHSARSSFFEWWLVNNTTSARKAYMASTGQWTWDGYSALTSQTDTSTYKPLGIDGSGNVIKMANWIGSGSNITLNNIGSGYRIAATPSGNFKSISNSNTIAWDSTSNTNSLTAKADTSLLATQYDLGYYAPLYNVDTTRKYVPLIVFAGESNIVGNNPNSLLKAADSIAFPRIQILHNVALSFQPLQMGINNNINVNLTGTFGMELQLKKSMQNGIPFVSDTVYLVKIGRAAATIQNLIDSLPTAYQRLDTAIAQIIAKGDLPQLYFWYSQGINDGSVNTDTVSWRNRTQYYINALRQRYPYFGPFFETKLIGNGAVYNNVLRQNPYWDRWTYYVNTDAATTQDPSHWDSSGLATIAKQMILLSSDSIGERDKYIATAANHIYGFAQHSSLNVDHEAYFDGIRIHGLLGNQFVGLGTPFYPGPTGNYNTGTGYESLQNLTSGSDNTAHGFHALQAITTGSDNVAFGYNALLSNTTGYNNTALGTYSLFSCTTGNNNTSIGYGALGSTSTGSLLTAVGVGAMQGALGGTGNTALGVNSLKNVSGDYSTATGLNALTTLTSGGYSVANGVDALYSQTTANHNIGIGYGAVRNVTTASRIIGIGTNANYVAGAGSIAIGVECNQNNTGSGNTVIGDAAGFGPTNISNCVMLGYNVGQGATRSNELWIDNSATLYPLLHGDFSADTLMVNAKLRIRDMDSTSSLPNIVYRNPITKELSIAAASLTTNAIVGTSTNDNATAGNIGEEISTGVSTYTNYTTTATYQAIDSITLTAGDWDISALGTFSSNGATITGASDAIFVISTTRASATGSTEGQSIVYVPQAALLGTNHESVTIAPYRVSLTGSTKYYLNTQATFTLGNPQYVGSLRARRMR